jgi:hypothetical protein
VNALGACAPGGKTDRVTPPAGGAALVVTPETVFTGTGLQGGPFTPGAATFTVKNVGTGTIAWTAQPSEDWLLLSITSGTLLPAEETVLLATFDPTKAGRLLPGIHTASVDFVNTTNGLGSTFRGVVLNVFRTPSLAIAPGYGITVNGPVGGPFSPASSTYTLSNPSSSPIDWQASVNAVGVLLSPDAGTIAPGDTTTITVTFDAGFAASLPLGNHQARITFVDQTNSITLTRSLSLNINAGPGGAVAASLSQFGITWTFAQDYPVGQFANGDWWVVGPIVVTNVDPPSDTAISGRVENGSMQNPSPHRGLTQGYDSETYGPYALPSYFNAQLNVALSVSPQAPLVLLPGTTLVSTISHSEPGLRPQLLSAAVLTVLDTPPPDGSFRPPYGGPDKTIRYNVAQLDRNLLARLAPVASAPPLSEVESWFERPWIDHVPLWAGNYLHPEENMPGYGRDMCDRISTAALMLHLDFPTAQKETLLVRFVQLGIDLWGLAQDGGQWSAAAGHMSGRKWPILFAGLMLGDAGMTAVGFNPSIAFGEDGQTFHVQETPPGSGVYNNGYGGYGPQNLGMPEWGTDHFNQPWFDDLNWFGDPYRLCCTANVWWGELLACYVMGAKALWNHDAVFDYQDRFLSENRRLGIVDWRLSWRPFYLDMWDAYRAGY